MVSHAALSPGMTIEEGSGAIGKDVLKTFMRVIPQVPVPYYVGSGIDHKP